MKIFYKKDFQRVLEKKIELEKEFEQYKKDTANSISALEDRNFKLFEENSKLKDSKLKNDVEVEKLKEELNSSKMETAAIKDELNKANRTIGGYKKSNNDYKKKNEALEKQVKELTNQVADLKSDRYRVKTIPSGRPHHGMKTRITDSSKESRIIKKVKERL